MRLIDIKFSGGAIPPYAILSHRWSSNEVDFKVFRMGRNRDSLGHRKVQKFCKVVKQYRGERTTAQGNENPFATLRHAWVDSCCIDARSSAELSEAIVSFPCSNGINVPL